MRLLEQRFASVSGFVLAGGAARRMGRSKAHLMLDHETTVERQVGLAGAVCGKVAVVGPQGDFPTRRVPVFDDVLPDCRPLGAIYAALLPARTEYCPALACGLPVMEFRFLRYLCAQALGTTAELTLPESPGGRSQHLCAV